MQYYYLNPDNTIQGPVSLTELRCLLDCGKINEMTKAAAAGDSRWCSVEELLQRYDDKSSTWNKTENSEMDATRSDEVQVPQQGRGVWESFVDSLRHSFNYSGCASRLEFWSFILFYAIFDTALDFILPLFLPESKAILVTGNEFEDVRQVINAVLEYLSQPAAMTICIISWAFSIAMLIPFLSLCVRRLHDTNRSAAALVCSVTACVTCVASAFYLVYQSYFLTPDMCNGQGFPSTEFIINFAVLIISGFLYLASLIYMFVIALLPSNLKSKYRKLH